MGDQAFMHGIKALNELGYNEDTVPNLMLRILISGVKKSMSEYDANLIIIREAFFRIIEFPLE